MKPSGHDRREPHRRRGLEGGPRPGLFTRPQFSVDDAARSGIDAEPSEHAEAGYRELLAVGTLRRSDALVLHTAE